MDDEAAFIQAIRANPDDDVVRLVYADWLEERGEVCRAEYLRLVCQFSRVPARLKDLSREIDPSWIASVLRRPVRALLHVLRGTLRGISYPVYEGQNYLGRADAEPVDIDLSLQEPPDRIWSSRQHALITVQDGQLFIEDLNTANGTYVNRARVYPGQRKPLNENDIVQIGAVQMQVLPRQQ